MHPLFGIDILNEIIICLYSCCNIGLHHKICLQRKSHFIMTGDRSFSVAVTNCETACHPRSVQQMNCPVSPDHLRLIVLGKPSLSKLCGNSSSLCITVTITILVLHLEYSYVNMLTDHSRTFANDLSFFNHYLFIFVYLLCLLVSFF